MSSRSMKILQMAQEIKATNPFPLRPVEETARKNVKQYTNLEPVKPYYYENGSADCEDAMINEDISVSIPASASTSANYLIDSDDSVKDPDYNLPGSKDAERFQSVESDISDSDNLPVTTPDTTASVCAKGSTKTAAIHELEYTKKGEVRKRKRFAKSVQERKEKSANKRQKKHYLRPGCKSCSRKCNEITDDHRASVNSQYWLMNWQERRVFISSNVSVHDVKRRRGTGNTTRNRTLKYFLKNEHGEIREVCKLFFFIHSRI